MAKKNKIGVDKNFGFGVQVKVTNPASHYHGAKGTIATGTLDSKGNYVVDFPLPIGKQVVFANDLDLDEEDELPPYVIMEAAMNDGYCNYSYEITSGTGLGDQHKVKGTGIFMDSLRHAFGRLNVHLACIDDVFKTAEVEIEDIDNFHAHEFAHRYEVSGIKIKGGKDDESVILIGSKYVSTAGGRLDISSPKIPLDNLSSYTWYNELKSAIDKVREEVALYKEGNYIQEGEEDEEKVPVKKRGRKPKQLTIGDEIDANRSADMDWSEDLENARV